MNGRDERGAVVVAITGASAGVGRATARRFAADGAAVALVARGQDGLAGAAADVESLGGPMEIPIDVADPDAVERAADQIEAELGPIDIWINKAMVTVFSPVGQMTAEDCRRVTDVTYLGAFTARWPPCGERRCATAGASSRSAR